jgi:4-carboxymuconolactone decarboxylase
MLISPEIGQSVQVVGASIRFRSHLTDRCRELAILTVAAERRSHFEWFAHEKAGLAAGLGHPDLQALLDGHIPEGLSRDERTAVSLARTMTRTVSVTQDEYDDAVDALSLPGLTDLIWLVGYYSTLALALEVLRPPAQQ